MFPVGLMLIVLLSVTLFWCGDTDCQTAGATDSCTALFCGLFGSDGPQNPAGTVSHDCLCVCHVPALPGPVSETRVYLFAQTTVTEPSPLRVFSPALEIYHPPRV